jgi:hypothetical protein
MWVNGRRSRIRGRARHLHLFEAGGAGVHQWWVLAAEIALKQEQREHVFHRASKQYR